MSQVLLAPLALIAVSRGKIDFGIGIVKDLDSPPFGLGKVIVLCSRLMQSHGIEHSWSLAPVVLVEKYLTTAALEEMAYNRSFAKSAN